MPGGVRPRFTVKLKHRLSAKHEYEKRQYISAPIIAGKQQQSFSDRHAKPYFSEGGQKTLTARSTVISLSALRIFRRRPAQKGDAEEHTPKFLKYCDEFNKPPCRADGGVLWLNLTPYFPNNSWMNLSVR
jgi:hypothetical protein